VRVLAIDFGERRIGLAISDPTRTLARPLVTIRVTARDRVTRVLDEIARLEAEDDSVSEVVVGRPLGLDGTPRDQTRVVDAFVAELRTRTRIPVMTEDERLSSREAESRLAVHERDWRKRKERLDAAAAAVVLQDYLDRR
jgi:putative Holliday junction resolvase